MAKKTLEKLHQQIAALQKEAAALKAKEIAGVVARIREAIAHYELTAEDLFGKSRASARAETAKPGPTGRAKAKPATKRVVPVKYRDSQGNTWTGRGNRPRWLVAALATGKKIEDFKV